MTAQLICSIVDDVGRDTANRDISALREGATTLLVRAEISESYFHRLRLEVARDPEFAKLVKVEYRGEEIGLAKEDEMRWPKGFLQESWNLEREIQLTRKKHNA